VNSNGFIKTLPKGRRRRRRRRSNNKFACKFCSDIYVGSSTIGSSTIGVCVTNPNYQDPSWHLSGVKYEKCCETVKKECICLCFLWGWFKKTEILFKFIIIYLLLSFIIIYKKIIKKYFVVW
jgi:hypothetical protein